MATDQPYLHILVDIPALSAYWRNVIAGVGRYCREREQVRLRLPNSEWEIIGDTETVDGVIAMVTHVQPDERITRHGKPIVNVSSVTHGVPFPTVTLDQIAVGRIAAEHLLAQGYRYFACHMDSRVYFSRQRTLGFRQRLEEAGKKCDIFDTAPAPDRELSAADLRRATTEWFHRLPKPVGVFTHNDGRATILLDFCRDIDLNVPEQVGILGMDNDEVVCLASTPTLSSIDVASDNLGYRAAMVLIDLIEGKPAPTEPILFPPRKVVERQSTSPILMDDDVISLAMSFIRDHVSDQIDVSDVLQVVPVARRSLERRFQERLGRSPGDEIRRAKIQRAQLLLVETPQPLASIAAACGYHEFRNFATAFKRETSMTPSAYRRAFRTT